MRVTRIVHLYRRRLRIDFWHEFCAAITVVSPNGRVGLGGFPPTDRVMSKKSGPSLPLLSFLLMVVSGSVHRHQFLVADAADL